MGVYEEAHDCFALHGAWMSLLEVRAERTMDSVIHWILDINFFFVRLKMKHIMIAANCFQRNDILYRQIIMPTQ